MHRGTSPGRANGVAEFKGAGVKLLLTLNSRSWVPPNVEASHRAAAERWGYNYLQILDRTRDIFGIKHAVLSKVWGWDRVCWIDGDAIVRHDCPEPIGNDPEAFWGVPGLQPWRDDEGLPDAKSVRCARNWFDGLAKKLGWDANIAFDPYTYINGGIFSFAPSLHAGVLANIPDLVPKVYPHDPHNAMLEQTLLNILLHAVVKRWELGPWSMNRVGPKSWHPGPMRWYVQHLAHCGAGKDKRAALAEIDWELSADEAGFSPGAEAAESHVLKTHDASLKALA